MTDRNNSNIQKFDGNGTLITKWGVNGTCNGELQGPEGVSVHLNGNVYVTEAENDRIQTFCPRAE